MHGVCRCSDRPGEAQGDGGINLVASSPLSFLCRLNSMIGGDLLVADPVPHGGVEVVKMRRCEVDVEGVLVGINLVKQYQVNLFGRYADIEQVTVDFEG